MIKANTGPTRAYKLFKTRTNGSIGSLFINASEEYPINTWMDSKPFMKNGFAFRQGWHCLKRPVAPHLKMKLKNGEVRQFWEIEVDEYEFLKRPESQGGEWILAQKIKLIKPLEK